MPSGDRFAAAVLVLLGALLLTGCGGGGSDGDDDTDSGTGTVVPSGPGVVVFVVLDSGNPELWAAVDDGSDLYRIDDPAGSPFSNIREWAVSPDRQWVAYATGNSALNPGIFVVPIVGGAPVEVTGNTRFQTTISQLRWSPDSSKLAYVSDQVQATFLSDQQDVFVVGRDGAGLQRIGIPGAFTDVFSNPLWSPDSRYVAFEITAATTVFFPGSGDPANGGTYTFAVYDTQTDTAVNPINSDTPGNTFFKELQGVAWSPDSQRIAYLMDRDVDQLFELYITTVDGASTVKAHPGIVDDVQQFAWNPADGSTIAYIAEQNFLDVSELYTSAFDGTQNERQHVALDSSDTNFDVRDFRFSPDGAHIAYRRDVILAGARTLFVNTNTAPRTFPLSEQSVAAFDINVLTNYSWLPDSSALIYGTTISNGTLFGVARNGINNHLTGVVPQPAPLNAPLTTAADIEQFTFALSPVDALMAYEGDADGDGNTDLYANSQSGNAEIRVSAPLGTGMAEAIEWFAWSASSSRIAYLQSSLVPALNFALYANDGAGGTPIKLSDDLNVVPSGNNEPSY